MRYTLTRTGYNYLARRTTKLNELVSTPITMLFHYLRQKPISWTEFTPLLGSGTVSQTQWRHQDLKSGGGKKGATIDYGGGKHVRVAHIESAKREPIFLNCWGPIFWGQTCARSAHSERVSASRFFWGGKHVRGVQGPALGPLAGCRGRAPAGGLGGGAPGRFWIYAFQYEWFFWIAGVRFFLGKHVRGAHIASA